MTPLHRLSSEVYAKLKDIGLLFELYPEASGEQGKDLTRHGPRRAGAIKRPRCHYCNGTGYCDAYQCTYCCEVGVDLDSPA